MLENLIITSHQLLSAGDINIGWFSLYIHIVF